MFLDFFRRLQLVRCVKGETVYRASEIASHLYIVIKGEVHILMDESDKLVKKC